MPSSQDNGKGEDPSYLEEYRGDAPPREPDPTGYYATKFHPPREERAKREEQAKQEEQAKGEESKVDYPYYDHFRGNAPPREQDPAGYHATRYRPGDQQGKVAKQGGDSGETAQTSAENKAGKTDQTQ
jgi:hypothetical protein